MSHKSIWSLWIFVFGILVTLSGFILAFIIPFFLPNIQDIFYNSFQPGTPIIGMNLNDLHHIDWIYGVLGGTMMGWGTLISMLAYQNMKEAHDWILDAILVSTISWYVADTAISAYYKVIVNIAFNTVVLILAIIPIVLEKVGRTNKN